MKSLPKAFCAATIAVLAIGIAGYWHYSPYLAIHGMRSAAQAGDATSFNEYVDYPALRENIKAQFTLAMGESIEESKDQPGLAAMGAALAMAMITPMVDAMVRPEVVIQAMARSNMELQPLPGAGFGGSRPEEAGYEQKWETRREGLNRFVVYPDIEGEPDDERVSAVFMRSGFATWKLSELRIPKLN